MTGQATNLQPCDPLVVGSLQQLTLLIRALCEEEGPGTYPTLPRVWAEL